MKFGPIASHAPWLGWLILVTICEIDLATAMLGLVLTASLLGAAHLLAGRLWWSEPKGRAAAGGAMLVAAATLFAATKPLALLPTASNGASSWALVQLAAIYAAIAVGTLVGLRLIASGSRDAFKRWRHHRSVRRQSSAVRRPGSLS
ncbi:MAG: hypothetical protein ACK4K7_03315 [Allosphingosinicella sp.]|uniref:hypothetical protein n=1 Tax=Allosphingosinicella sp. TaxID=2823234 RepID=UPI00392071EC